MLIKDGQMLTASDLRSDPILVRKIKRIQAAENGENDDSDDERHELRQGTIGDDSINEIGSSNVASLNRSQAPRIKSERLASSARQASMVPNTQVQRLVRESQPPTSSGTTIVDLEDADDSQSSPISSGNIVDMEDPDEEDEE